MCRWMQVCGSRTWAFESCGRANCKGLATSHYFAVSAGRPASAGFRILSPPQQVRHLSNVYICFCDHLTVNQFATGTEFINFFERCADTAWGRYRLGPQLTSCQDLHQIEENHKVPKEKTTMGFGENVYSQTNSAGYSRRETRCN